MLDGVRDRGAELAPVERLLEVVADALAQTGHRRCDTRVAGHQDDGGVGMIPADLLGQPHAILPGLHRMIGVMAISREGLHFETPDGRPVHCMVLLGTSEDERERHLQVLAALAQTIGTDVAFQEKLFDSRSPAHAYDLMHDDQSVHFNYFLGDDA